MVMVSLAIVCRFITSLLLVEVVQAMSNIQKTFLRDTAKEMFFHAYNAYMEYAYPADELMPLSCKGRVRGRDPARGDVDDALGRFSLTLVDAMDTLAVLGEIEEFSLAVRRVVQDVSLDTDIIVSVFETNIRVLGGLLSSHVLADLLHKQGSIHLHWYKGELLELAEEVGRRLLPAFNTTTGIPHARVNLRHGITEELKRLYGKKPASTCTACGGSLIMEFAALSRLSGNPIYELKARKTMQAIWKSRNAFSNLVGSVIDINTGAWIRQDSGIGAGIDSYYEYCLKSYVLLGDLTYWERFSKHYDSVMRYVNTGPAMVDVFLGDPKQRSKIYMDSLLAFWPGLQVLKGDLRPAIELHHMLYHVMKRHKFLPEAFTVDYQVHWAHHPLRPEFIESTYFLYMATKDPHYLTVGEMVIDSLQKHARVPCGFAAVSDVRTLEQEDRMDSFVLAETFKYLYLLFADSSDLTFDMDDFVFTTEAHLLPLTLANIDLSSSSGKIKNASSALPEKEDNEPLSEMHSDSSERSCPNVMAFGGFSMYANKIRDAMTFQTGPDPWQRRCKEKHSTRNNENYNVLLVDPQTFDIRNPAHLELISLMGVSVVNQADGSVQLVHNAQTATSAENSRLGMIFMQEMLKRVAAMDKDPSHKPVLVEVLSPKASQSAFIGGPSLFGPSLVGDHAVTVSGVVVVADPLEACISLLNPSRFQDKIVLILRGGCLFMEKVRNAAAAGALAAVIADSVDPLPDRGPFAMSGDGSEHPITIPSTFLLKADGRKLFDYFEESAELTLRLGPQISTDDGTDTCFADKSCDTGSDDSARESIGGT